MVNATLRDLKGLAARRSAKHGTPVARLLVALARETRASVATIAAVSLVALIAFGALAVDVNRALSERVENQMVADAAALSAAVAYSAGGNSSAVLAPTAQDIALANGLATSAIAEATAVSNYPASGDTSVKVVVRTAVPFSLAAVLSSGSAFSVTATAYARLPTTTSSTTNPCFVALSSGSNALQTSGGATINMPSCDAYAVGGVYNGGTGMTVNKLVSGSSSVGNNYGSISANLINYATSWTNPGWNTAVPSADKIVQKSTTITDGLASSSTLSDARSLLGSYTAPTTLANPATPSGTNWSFTSSSKPSEASGSSGNYTVPPGNYTIGSLSIAGGVRVQFNGTSTITIANGVNIGGGSTVNFGNTTMLVNGGFVSGSSGVTFGNGNVTIGSGTVTFAGTNTFGTGNITINADVSISGGSSITMGAGNHAFKSITVGGGSWLKMGDGDLDVTNGISVGGSSTVAAGAGAYRIGKNASSSKSIDLSGSAVMIMGNGTFSASGHINTAGGSRLVFGATANHYINGNMTIAGSVLLGAGRYTVNGNFTNGTGGTTWPYTSTVTGATYGNTLEGTSVSGYDMAGINVSFILAGTVNLGGGAKTKLIAPTSSTTGGAIADLLIESQTSSATNWGAGSANVFVGMVHLPNSSVTMSGGSTTLSSGQCFMLTAYTISVTGGAATGSACASINSTGSTSTSSSNITLVN